MVVAQLLRRLSAALVILIILLQATRNTYIIKLRGIVRKNELDVQVMFLFILKIN